ncbi:hypothetical protein [Mycolicibacterium smegmatis]|uniref:hypothetical protein n=1 Tax=Mycolicibacterium smegmatis TaxID=1772 RepID=UPI001303546D|nr:hypothetical protein [Mycolicibacterium smegmatis]
MTANDQPSAAAAAPQTGYQATGTEPVAPQQQLAQTQPIPPMGADGTQAPVEMNQGAAVGQTQTSQTDTNQGAAAGHTDGMYPNTGEPTDGGLFADDDRTGLRARWDALQASFVDNPKQCVQEADGLVEEVVQRLTASFAHARSRLDEQWSQGQDASTEDLRIALQRYRDFFQRLLTV